MGAGAQHIDLVFVHVDGFMSIGLDRVRMEKDSMLLRDLPDFFDWFDGPDLIIGKHYRQKDRIRTDRLFYLLRIHKSKFVHRQGGDFKALFFHI